jgi:2'-5' RNA ligase
MIRLFVAIELPEALRGRLATLSGGIPQARWIPPQNMHLTLRFIGEVSGTTASDVDEALEGVRAPAFDLTLDGIGTFGKKARSRVIWAGVTPSPPLLHLHAKIESAVVRAGLAPEGRKFAPHVALARLKNGGSGRIGDYLAAHNPFRSEPFRVGHFTLFSSFLSQSGAIYTAEASYPLKD